MFFLPLRAGFSVLSLKRVPVYYTAHTLLQSTLLGLQTRASLASHCRRLCMPWARLYWITLIKFIRYYAHVCACMCVRACVRACACVCVCIRDVWFNKSACIALFLTCMSSPTYPSPVLDEYVILLRLYTPWRTHNHAGARVSTWRLCAVCLTTVAD